MSNAIQALEKYTKVVEERNKYIESNKAVFDTHEQIAMRIIDAENELRDAVADEKAGVQNESFTVRHVAQTQTYADIEVIDQMVAGGKITAGMRAEIVKTVDRPARVSILPTPTPKQSQEI
jgi:hypothetical protein